MIRAMPGAARAPLIVVASQAGSTADEVAARLRSQGAVAYATHSAQGCLRVSTSIGPDLVVIDPALWSARLERLIRAHPTSAHSCVRSMTADDLRDGLPAQPVIAAAA